MGRVVWRSLIAWGCQNCFCNTCTKTRCDWTSRQNAVGHYFPTVKSGDVLGAITCVYLLLPRGHSRPIFRWNLAVPRYVVLGSVFRVNISIITTWPILLVVKLCKMKIKGMSPDWWSFSERMSNVHKCTCPSCLLNAALTVFTGYLLLIISASLCYLYHAPCCCLSWLEFSRRLLSLIVFTTVPSYTHHDQLRSLFCCLRLWIFRCVDLCVGWNGKALTYSRPGSSFLSSFCSRWYLYSGSAYYFCTEFHSHSSTKPCPTAFSSPCSSPSSRISSFSQLPYPSLILMRALSFPQSVLN